MGSKPLPAEERAADRAPPSWVRSVGAGYPLLRAAGAALHAAGEHFVDASRAFAGVEDTLYYDHCHFVYAGNRILCELVAREVLADLH